jgi:hypothetical protein
MAAAQKHIDPVRGESTWVGADMRATDRWLYRLSVHDVADLEHGLASVRKRGLQIPFSRSDFPIGELQTRWQRYVGKWRTGQVLCLFAIFRSTDGASMVRDSAIGE